MLASEFFDAIPAQPGEKRRPSRADVRAQFERETRTPAERSATQRAQQKAERDVMRRLREDDRRAFVLLCLQNGLPQPVPEWPVVTHRQWRFDFAFPEQKVALEVDGGVWTGGRHTRGAGWTKDTEKLNTAQGMGWRVLRCTPATRDSAETLAAIRAALTYTPSEP